jgi:hypothetical protein
MHLKYKEEISFFHWPVPAVGEYCWLVNSISGCHLFFKKQYQLQ